MYKIGVDDVIQITVLDHDELKTVSSVSLDGTINMPYIGSIQVLGKTVTEVEQEITEKLKEGYIKFPIVAVTLLRSLSKEIFTYGEINKIGKIQFEKDMSIGKAMSIAGGVTNDGRYGKIRVRRKQEGESGGYKDIVEAKLNDGAIVNSEIEDMLLQPDDILIVERSKTFLIQGEVASRGRFVLEKDMTVLRALLQAGGVNENGRYGKIKVRRKQETGGYKDLVESPLDDGKIVLKEVEDTVLQPDDILIVERSKTFLIQGEVASRGRFVLEKDMTVLRALLQAGGVNENGRYGKIKVRRKQETGEYKDLVESPLDDGKIVLKEVEDTVLQPDDILIVEPNSTFFIYGEVNKKGEFILKKDMTVFKAITIAGGLTKWGSEGKIKILRPINNGESFEIIKVNIKDVIEGDASADVVLENGDTIIVSTGIF
jgi:polysaccharide export outer membrane protein